MELLNIGVLNQDFARYQLSARDNIGFGNLKQRENQLRIEQAALDSGADRVVETLAQGYQTRLGKMFKGWGRSFRRTMAENWYG